MPLSSAIIAICCCAVSSYSFSQPPASATAPLIAAIGDVRAAAEKLKDPSTQEWTYSFEAYCLSTIKRYGDAIAAQLICMQFSPETDPLDHYNIACYYALFGKVDAAFENLKRAINSGGERYKTFGQNDPDFSSIRGEQRVIDMLGPAADINPAESPDKAPPPPSAEGKVP